MSEDVYAILGDIKKIYQFCEDARITPRVLLELLNKEGRFEDTTPEERTHLYSFLGERSAVIRQVTPLEPKSYIWSLDITEDMIGALYALNLDTVEKFNRTSNRQISELNRHLTASRLNPLREQIRDRFVNQAPPIEDSFNQGN